MYLGLDYHFFNIYNFLNCCCCFSRFFPSDNRAGPSNLGNVISQILLCKQITPDFNQEELCSITKDSQDIAQILSEMQEFMPRQETILGMYTQITIHISLLFFTSKCRHEKTKSKKKMIEHRFPWFHFFFHIEKASALTNDEINGGPWPAKRRRNSIYKNMGLLCCVSRPNYLWD